jgi:hypothetical protein
MDDALHRRLDDIERRQRRILALLVLPYLVGLAGLFFSSVDFETVFWFAFGVVALAFVALLYIGFRSRRPSRRGTRSR